MVSIHGSGPPRTKIKVKPNIAVHIVVDDPLVRHDVRDVTDLHLRAMTHPDAPGERFLVLAG